MGLSESRILVTGSCGMLAGDLVPRLVARCNNVLLTDHHAGEVAEHEVSSLDICNSDAIATTVQDFKPHWIFNCAAYTAVDDAEEQQDLAFAVNGDGVRNLAQVARETDARLLHVSTDYVFGADVPYDLDQRAGLELKPHREEDPINPCGVYGKSKRQGEEYLLELLPERHLLIRTSWLHGVHGPNFIDTMLRLGAERDSLSIVNDQCGSPTWTGWLSDTMLDLAERDAAGIYHATSRGNITWLDFATEIFKQAGIEMELAPQTTAELGRPAPRPAYSTLDVSKVEEALSRPCISWIEGLKQHLSHRAEV